MKSDLGFDWAQQKQKISMAQKAGRKLKFMAQTACVHKDEREIIAWCENYKLINPDDKEFSEFLEKTIIPIFTKLGRARWFRDQVTDLGFALSTMSRDTTTESTSKILDE